MTPENCGSCRFWFIEQATIWGTSVVEDVHYCRRMPPILPIKNGQGGFPYTKDIDWCGEYQPRDVEAAK